MPVLDQPQTRKLQAAASVSSYNDEDGTFEAVIATEAPVARYFSGEGRVNEVLDVAGADLSRLGGGMAMLDSHDAFQFASRLGTVETVRRVGKTLVARIRLFDEEHAGPVRSALRAGHRLPVSIGYRVHEYAEDLDTNPPTYRATRWELLEVSVVNIPADAGAYTRAMESSMPNIEHETETRDDSSANPIDGDATRAERGRAEILTDLARRYGMNEGFVRQHVRGGSTESEFKQAIVDHMLAEQERTSTFPHIEARGMQDEHGAGHLDAMADALVARLRPGHQPSERAREYVGMTMVDMARECLRSSGHRVNGLHGARLVSAALEMRGMHSSSDFAHVLSTGLRTTLAREYEALASQVRQCFRQETAENFKEISRLDIGSFPQLLPVNEHGEFKRGPILGEGKEAYRIGTFGRVLGITRQALVNDDLNALRRVMDSAPRAAADFESDFLVTLLESNPLLSDGKAVFHADHLNVGTAAALSVETLDLAIRTVERQKAVDGKLIYQTPKFLVVPSELRMTARRILAEITATKSEDVNPMAGALQLVVEPRLTDPTAWYVAADPAIYPGAEYAYLAGFEGPYVETRDGFDVDGVELKVRLDFGAGWTSHRGWYRNPGQ